MKHIGIVAVSAPGAALCYTAIAEISARSSFAIDPEITISALSYKNYIAAIKEKNWDQISKYILSSIEKLKKAGTDFIIIPANTVHFAIDQVKASSILPIISLLDVTVTECINKNYKKVLVLGTEHTMMEGLYTSALAKNGLTEITPDPDLQKEIHSLIIDQLIPEKIDHATVNSLINSLQNIECDAVILACTELPIVINENNLGKSVIDTTRLLAKAAFEFAANR